MECAEIRNRLEALIDGELPVGESEVVSSHLMGCPDCRQVADRFRNADARLRAAFAERRRSTAQIGQRVAAQLALGQPEPARPRLQSWRILLAVAAGFLLATLIFQPYREPPTAAQLPSVPRPDPLPPDPTPSQPEPEPAQAIARLEFGTGDAEMLAPGVEDWLLCSPGSSLAPGARLRTGPNVLCAFTCPSDAQVCLNDGTEVLLADETRFRVPAGQVWAEVPAADRPLIIESPQAIISCSNSKFDVRCESDKSVLTVAAGSVRVNGPDFEREVTAGQRVTIDATSVSEIEELGIEEVIYRTRWVHPLLASQPAQRDQLQERLRTLLAIFGKSKMSLLYEDEIRVLGDFGAASLLEYVRSPLSQDDPFSRVRAARILADMAPVASIPELIVLLDDPEEDVRGAAAQALARLTGRDFDRPPAWWRTQPHDARADAQTEWQSWWNNNRQRYPNG